MCEEPTPEIALTINNNRPHRNENNMATLDDMVNRHDENPWTPEELADWVSKLPENKRIPLLDTLKEAKRTGLNMNKIVCLYRKHEKSVAAANKWQMGDVVNAVADFSRGWWLGGLIMGQPPAVRKGVREDSNGHVIPNQY